MSELERTINFLEQSVLDADLDLSSKKCEREKICRITDVLAVTNLEQSALREKKALAEKSFEKVKSIEGLHCWKLSSIKNENISLCFKFDSIGISITVDFASTGLGSVVCNAQLLSDSDITSSSRSSSKYYLFPSSVDEYFSSKAENICREVNGSVLSAEPEISHVVHHLEWYMGRVEIVGKELSKVINRYKGRLQQSKADYQLSIQFFDSGENAHKIKANFEIRDSYPFGLLPFELEGEGDLDTLRRLLIKSCKPGFGYLSRMCDIISAMTR